MMLSERQVAVLRAAVDRMIPPDEFPGGWEGGVGDYLLRQFGRDLKDQVAVYAQGLDALDAESHARTGKPFDELDAESQDQLLDRVQVGYTRIRWPIDPVVFIVMLAEHSAEGYYSDPTHNGGNRGGMAWKMIGFEVTG